MKELLAYLPISNNIDYLVDTCFIVYIFKLDLVKKFEEFCQNNRVGISTFNFNELVHIHHKFPGNMMHHVRIFFKKSILFKVPIEVTPGNQNIEKEYVKSFDPKILEVIKDPSDAVLLVLALRLKANILTRDKHHIFTAAAENYSYKYNIKILNDF